MTQPSDFLVVFTITLPDTLGQPTKYTAQVTAADNATYEGTGASQLEASVALSQELASKMI